MCWADFSFVEKNPSKPLLFQPVHLLNIHMKHFVLECPQYKLSGGKKFLEYLIIGVAGIKMSQWIFLRKKSIGSYLKSLAVLPDKCYLGKQDTLLN